ncbi:MAG: efflux RND transporter periplasmic adaptor subunit [Propylenella sp.]
MMLSRIVAFAIVVAATLWIGSGVFGRTEEPAKTAVAEAQAPRPLFRVAVVEAQVESHTGDLVLSGRTEADDRAKAMTRAEGMIVELKVRRGDLVAEGDVIATLSDDAREAQVSQAEAMVEKRRTDVEAKTRLIERGVMAANEKMQLEADLRAAEAALALAKAEFERGLVLAPISGVVSEVPVRAGQALEAGAVVAEVIALDPMLAVAGVAERQLGDVKPGGAAAVRLVTGQTETGTVRFVSPTASPGTRTYRVEVELSNADRAIPDGVTAEVEFRLAPANAVRLPRSALTFSAAGDLSVRTVAADGTVASVPVAIVEDAREEVWVSGPEDGAKVIVQGQDFVKDGQKVEAVEGSLATPAVVSQS